jgi:putative oxidoreductase
LLRGSALMIAVMLGVFIIAISAALVRGLDISCGCFTVEGGHSVAVDLLVRDVLMFAGALIVMFLGTSAFSLKRSTD